MLAASLYDNVFLNLIPLLPFIATLMPQITILLPQNYKNYIFSAKNMKKEGKSLHSDSFFVSLQPARKVLADST